MSKRKFELLNMLAVVFPALLLFLWENPVTILSVAVGIGFMIKIANEYYTEHKVEIEWPCIPLAVVVLGISFYWELSTSYALECLAVLLIIRFAISAYFAQRVGETKEAVDTAVVTTTTKVKGEYQGKIDEQNKKIETQKGQIKGLQDDNNAKDEKIAQAKEDINRKDRTIKAGEAALIQTKTELARTNQKLEVSTVRLGQAQEQLVNTQEKLRDKSAQVNTLERDNQRIKAENERLQKKLAGFEQQHDEMAKQIKLLDSENKEIRSQAQQKIDALSRQFSQDVNRFDHTKYEKCLNDCRQKYQNFPKDVLETIATGVLMKEYLSQAEMIRKSYEMSLFCMLKSVETIVFKIYENPRLKGYIKAYFKSKPKQNPNKEPTFAELCNVVELNTGHDWRDGFADELNKVRVVRNKIMHKNSANEVENYDEIYDILMVGGKRAAMLAYLNQKLMELR